MRIVTGVLALSLIAQCVYAANDEANFVSKIARTVEFVEKNQENIWPGFSLKKTPLVIDIANWSENTEHVYALNFKPGQLPWQRTKVEGQDVYYLNQNDFDYDLGFHDGQLYEVDGQMSFIDAEEVDDLAQFESYYNKLTLNRASWYLRHESAINGEHVAGLGIPYAGFNDVNNMKLMYLENAALETYLTSKGKSAETALQDAVAVHQFRQSQLVADQVLFENTIEIYSGLATFISAKSMNYSADEYTEKAKVLGCAPIREAGVDGFMQCSMSGTGSFTSAALGKALEEKLSSNNWKKAVERDFTPTSKIMQDYFGMTNEKAQSLTAVAMENPVYKYKTISTVVDGSLVPHLQRMETALNNYKAESGVEFKSPWVFNFITIAMSSMFGEPELYFLNSNTAFMLDFDGDFSLSGENDEDVILSLEFKHLADGFCNLVFDKHYEIDNDKSLSVHKLENQTKLVIDGAQTTVDNFVKARLSASFTSLVIENEHYKFTTKLQGNLDARDGTLTLTMPSLFGTIEKLNQANKLKHKNKPINFMMANGNLNLPFKSSKWK